MEIVGLLMLLHFVGFLLLCDNSHSLPVPVLYNIMSRTVWSYIIFIFLCSVLVLSLSLATIRAGRDLPSM